MSMNRRTFVFSAATATLVASAPLFARSTRAAKLTHKERVDRALAGQDVDYSPYSHWHHFGPQDAKTHAASTLDYHRRFNTDIVKVMSDFKYPQPAGKWYEAKALANPFPEQIEALKLIQAGLNGDAYFIETAFNPYQVAVNLSSRDEVVRLQSEDPQALLDALDAITTSHINHARLAYDAGASGILFSVANANPDFLSVQDYARFSEPFDRRFTDAIGDRRLNTLHLHWQQPYVSHFAGFKSPVINWSTQVSGVPVETVRKLFPDRTLATGIDEVKYKELTVPEIRQQYLTARKAAGKQYILVPGCSVPNDSSDAELRKLGEAAIA